MYLMASACLNALDPWETSFVGATKSANSKLAHHSYLLVNIFLRMHPTAERYSLNCYSTYPYKCIRGTNKDRTFVDLIDRWLCPAVLE